MGTRQTHADTETDIESRQNLKDKETNIDTDNPTRTQNQTWSGTHPETRTI